MNSKKTIRTIGATLALALSLSLAVPVVAEAATINFTAVRSGLGSFGGVAVDPTTGQFYYRSSYGPGYGSGNLEAFANEAAFAAGAMQSSVALAGGGFYGTYFSVSQGQLYGRADNFSSATKTWSVSTGGQTGFLGGYAGMGGGNGADTFDWGGFSGVNFMQDSTGRYVVGGVAVGNNWQIERLGPGLNSVATTVYTPIGDPNLGYGFIINGVLFTGSDFYSTLVSNAVNVTTGAVSSVAHNLVGLGGGTYLSDFSYDYASDTLYAFNTGTGTLYKAANASTQFGVGQQVPEPGTLALALVALAGMAARRRKSAGVR